MATVGNETIIYADHAISIVSIAQFVYMYVRENTIEFVQNVVIALLVYLAASVLVYSIMFGRRYMGGRQKLLKDVKMPFKERVLIVTAHPDDAVMYFGPTVLSLTQKYGCQVYLLCLSNGDVIDESINRRMELWSSCKTLHIPDEHITVCRYSLLPGSPHVKWKVDVVAKKILDMLAILDIQLAITFDREGINQHPNHQAIYSAMASLCMTSTHPPGCRILTLETVNVVRKYISIFDVIGSLILSTNWCILGWADRCIVLKAMRQHKSHCTWTRILSNYFSRYMIVNTLREMTPSDVELEMQINDGN